MNDGVQKMIIKKATFGNVVNETSNDRNNHTRRILNLLGLSYIEDDGNFIIDKMFPLGCNDPEHTQEDGNCLCNECSMGENSEECLSFRNENKLQLRY